MSAEERAWATLELCEAAADARAAIARREAAILGALRAGMTVRETARLSGLSHVTVAKRWRDRP